MKHIYIVAIILAIQSFYTIKTAPVETLDEKLEYRLTKKILPSHYNIQIKPYILKAPENRKQFQFDGIVEITLQAKEENLKEIILHTEFIEIAKKEDIELKKIKKTDEETEDIKVTEKKYEQITNLLNIKLETELEKDTDYILKIKYIGEMKDDMQGFYKSSYKDKDGKDVWIGSTQFQTSHARRAFPCFDEPSFKATFDVSINHEIEFKTVIGNTDIKEDKPEGDDRKITSFKTTPKMSTYIVAFLVSNFDGPSENKFSVIARPEYKDQTKFSFEDGQKILKELNDYTGLEYKSLGNDKMHMAAIPDFSAGAMENWGLLTYRERGLLYDTKETTDAAQQSIALAIAHEQTHMWFGNHITCDWWDHTWLNEGFARYFEYFISQKVYEKWSLDKQFVVDLIHTIFVTDSLANTHPLSDKNINSPTDAKRMFDLISYNKAASIIRMFRYSMGEENFKNALRKYLKNEQNRISKPENLFDVFEVEWKPKDVDTRKFFKEWTEQVGYPVVSVKVKNDGKQIEVSQKRFLLEDDAGDKDLKYTIPFTYTTQKKSDFSSPKPENIQLITDSKTIDLAEDEQLSESDYIIANIEQMGYFRVMYEKQMLHNIHHALTTEDFGKISAINRAHLIDDLFNFARSRHLNYEDAFDLLSYLKTETDYIPWKAAFNGFKFIEMRLGEDNVDLKNRLHIILEKVYTHLKFEQKDNENRLDTYNRASVLEWACKYDFDNCNSEAEKLFENFKKEPENNKINKNIRSVVYCSVLRKAEKSDNYDFLQTHFKNTKSPTENVLTLNALGCVQNEKLVEKHYKFLLSQDVRKQDVLAALNALIAENPGNAEKVFNLIKEDHKALRSALGGTDDDLANVITNIANRFTTVDQKKLIEKFAEKEMTESAKEKIKNAAKNIEKNIKWLSTFRDDLIKGLRGGVAMISFSTILVTSTAILCYIMNY